MAGSVPSEINVTSTFYVVALPPHPCNVGHGHRCIWVTGSPLRNKRTFPFSAWRASSPTLHGERCHGCSRWPLPAGRGDVYFARDGKGLPPGHTVANKVHRFPVLRSPILSIPGDGECVVGAGHVPQVALYCGGTSAGVLALIGCLDGESGKGGA